MKNLVFLVFLLMVILSCKKSHEGDAVPEITFESLRIYQDAAGTDTALDLVFKFKDKNGDISYTQAERNFVKCGQDLHDLLIFYEEKRGNDFYPQMKWDTVWTITSNCDSSYILDSVQVSYNQFLTFIEPSNDGKPIEGIVSYRMQYAPVVFFLKPVGRFRFYIKDRAGNKSNEVYSTEYIRSY